MTPDPVAVILRNRGESLVCRPRATSARDRWTTILGPVTDTDCDEYLQPGVTDQAKHVLRRENCDSTGVQSHGSPYEESETAGERRDGDAIADRARDHLRAEADLTDDEIQFVRAGDPVPGGSDSRPDRVVPVLFDCESRSIVGDAGPDWEWIAPPALLEADGVPWLWRVYDAVRPTVGTVADDTEHGSTTLSVRALEVLRDEAALAARTDADPSAVRDVARDLIAARSSMTAVRNRLNRVMTAVDGEEMAASVTTAAHEAIQRAIDADGEAAANAATRIAGGRVATLSRSGTVLEAIAAGEPSAVLVAESRPGREGVTVAETLAADSAVTLTTDAAFPTRRSPANSQAGRRTRCSSVPTRCCRTAGCSTRSGPTPLSPWRPARGFPCSWSPRPTRSAPTRRSIPNPGPATRSTRGGLRSRSRTRRSR